MLDCMSPVSSATAVFPRLASLARAKMHAVFGHGGAREDSAALHRWVLLKNSLTASTPSLPADSTGSLDEDVEVDGTADAFMFPLLDDAPAPASEAEWLDSLLAALGDDEDDEPEPASPLSCPAIIFVTYPPPPYPPLCAYPPPPYPPVPDAIEDTSDDESEGTPRTPSTPSALAGGAPRIADPADDDDPAPYFFAPLPFGYAAC